MSLQRLPLYASGAPWVAGSGVPRLIDRQDLIHPDSFAGSRTIAFTCHGCGDCCKGSTIILSPFDFARLAAFSGEPPRAMLKERCILLKHPQTNLPTVMLETVPRCSFLDDENRCTAYGDRPLVCRGYPLGVLTDLNRPEWRASLTQFSIRASPCPKPQGPSPPLPMVRTLHAMATDAGMEVYAEAYRTWARLCWDIATESPYPELPPEQVAAFDRELVDTFFRDAPAPQGESQTFAEFIARVRAFRARHRLLRAPRAEVSGEPLDA